MALMRLWPIHGGGRSLDHATMAVLSLRGLGRSVAGSVVSMAYRLVFVIHLRHPVGHDPQLLLRLVWIVRCQQDSKVVRPFHASVHRELHRELRLLPRFECRRPDDNSGRSAPFQDFRDGWDAKAQRAIARVADQEASLDHLVHWDISEIDGRLVYHQIWRARRASCVELGALAGLPGQQAHHNHNAHDGHASPEQPRRCALPGWRHGRTPGARFAGTELPLL